MANEIARLRFIPFRRRDIVEMCLQSFFDGNDKTVFQQLALMLDQIFHFEFHQVVETMKDAYASIDPDTDTLPAPVPIVASNQSFVELLDGLLEKANYERVTEADLDLALTESSLFKIRLQVEFDDFQEVLLFTRGESLRREEVKYCFGLRRKILEFVNFERVVVYLRVRDDYQPSASDFAGCRPGATLLKLFRNVPRADLEMLFPNTQVRMRLLDKLLIGVPAVISGGVMIATKLGASLLLVGSLLGFWLGIRNQPVELNQTSIIVLFAGLAAIAGYLWKQFSAFKNRKLLFMQALTQNLYFKNLDNNAGVFHRLVNDANEEESKEAILAYCFLLQHPSSLNRAELDQQIESWFSKQWNCELDFEIDDAMQKLLTLGLVSETMGKLNAVPIEQGIRLLDQRWDNYFTPPPQAT